MPGDQLWFGREPEMAVLDSLLDGVRVRGGAALLLGAPGIGKSALLDETSRGAVDRGMQVLRTTGIQSEAQMPFAGLHQLLRPLVGHVDQLPAAQRDGLLGAFGESSDAPDLFLVALAALTLLSECAARTPILLIADDAHWLDGPTSTVLTFLARRLESDQLVLLVAGREGYRTTFDDAGLPEVHLTGLDEPAAGALLDSRAPDLAPAVRERILAEASGNPLALVELPIAWRERDGDGAMADGLPLTERVKRSFASRAGGLPAATQTLLLVAALDDGDAPGEVLGAASIVAGSELTLPDLAPAQAARLLDVHETGVRFAHPLIRESIRQSADLSDRLAGHAALATVLADQPDRRAWHRAASTVAPDEEIAAELESAAHRAGRRHGGVAAVAALQRAAELSEAPRRRGARLLSAAQLAFELGDTDAGHHLLSQVEHSDLAPPDRRKLLWLNESRADAFGHGSVSSCLVLADQMVRAGEIDPALDSLLTAAYKCFWFNSDQATRARVVAAAERLPVEDRNLKLLSILALADPAERGAVVIRRLATVDPSAHEDPEALRVCGTALTTIPEFELASAFLARAIDGLRAQGRLSLLARALMSHASAVIYLGEWNQAMQSAAEAARLADETEQPRWAASAKVAMAHVAGARGETDRARSLLDEAELVIAPIGVSPTFAMVQAARGEAALSAGHPDEAFEYTHRMFNPSDSAYSPSNGIRVLADLADAAVRSGHVAEAKGIVDEVQQLAAQTTSRYAQASVTYARPILADDDRAEGLFESALAGDLTRWPFLHARLLLAHGAWLRRQRRVSEARAPLRTAREAFEVLGAAPWADRARQELRASGETSRRRSPDRRDELTPQERQIARMAADGLTNREIGQRLFLSHRTIGSHLYRIFPKLGVSSRAELRREVETLWPARSGAAR